MLAHPVDDCNFLLEGLSPVPFSSLGYTSDRVIFLKNKYDFHSSSKTSQLAFSISWSKSKPLTLAYKALHKAPQLTLTNPSYYIYPTNIFCSSST